MSAEDEHRFAAIEARLSSMEAGMVKRDDQIASIMNSLTRIEMLLGGTMGSDGLVHQVGNLKTKSETQAIKLASASGFGAAIAFFIEHFLKK